MISTISIAPNSSSAMYRTEQELVRGLRRQEPMGCTCLFEQFEPRLRHMALKLTGEFSEAEDIVQESFIRACASIMEFRAESMLSTWLHRIVLNTALMHQRRKQLPLLPLESVGEEEYRLSAWLPGTLQGDPEQMILQKEQRIQILQAIDDLPTALRDAFLLRALAGASTKEAASSLGISESALKVRFHRARLTLQERLA